MVTDDIVTRLRNENNKFDFYEWNDAERLMLEAADEIERLRGLHSDLSHRLYLLENGINDLYKKATR